MYWFIYLAYNELQKDLVITGILSAGCAILFNPIFKIYFHRKIWNQIDLVIATLLIIWTITDLLYKKSY